MNAVLKPLIIYNGHTDGVFCIAWSPDGKWLASGGRDATVHIWEARTGRLQTTFRDHALQVMCLAWSPDGEQIASSSFDEAKVRLWEALNSQPRGICVDPECDDQCLAWSPDSRYLASASGNTMRDFEPYPVPEHDSVHVWQDIPGAWLRLRHEGDRITLTLKAITGQAIELQQELEIEVNDFEQTSVLLSMLGCRRRAYQESKRELWDLDGVQITLDTWPFLEPFVEVEGSSEQAVRDACTHLQLPYEEAIFGSIDQLYARRYNISREVITQQISNLAFTEDSRHEFNHYINQ